MPGTPPLTWQAGPVERRLGAAITPLTEQILQARWRCIQAECTPVSNAAEDSMSLDGRLRHFLGHAPMDAGKHRLLWEDAKPHTQSHSEGDLRGLDCLQDQNLRVAATGRPLDRHPSTGYLRRVWPLRRGAYQFDCLRV